MQQAIQRVILPLPPVVLLCLVLAGCDQVEQTQSRGANTPTTPAPVPVQTPVAEINRAVDLYEARQFDAAAAAFKAILQRHPDHSGVLSSYGFALLELDQLDEAKAAFEKSISNKPEWADPYLGLGIVARMNDNYDQAYHNYEKALTYNPKDGQVLASMLVIDLRRGDFELAVKHGEQAAALQPNSPVIHANLAVACHYINDFEKRDAMVKKAIVLGYQNIDALQDIFSGKTTVGPD